MYSLPRSFGCTNPADRVACVARDGVALAFFVLILSFFVSPTLASEKSPVLLSPDLKLEVPSGMQVLSDADMGRVGAQGLVEDYRQLQALADSLLQKPERDIQEDEDWLRRFLETNLTLGGILDATLELEGVRYDRTRFENQFAFDDGFVLRLPAEIERLTLRDIRPAGSSGATMGTIQFEGIRISEESFVRIQIR